MNKMVAPRRACIAACLVSFIALGIGAQSASIAIDGSGMGDAPNAFNPLFPRALNQAAAAEMAAATLSVSAAELPHGPSVESQPITDPVYPDPNRLQSVLLNNDVFSLYGKPGARNMGILGQYSLSDIEPVMNDFLVKYDAANGQRGVIPSFYIIYGTCWPEGEIGILQDRVVKEYIDFAAERGWYVYLDHQIGKYTVEAAMAKLLPWLKYPNVHLALDPEWRTTKPMQEIGYVTADELNRAQALMQDYLVEHRLPGRRMLVVHQFKPKMIQDRAAVRSNFELVQLIHCADGFGSPMLKKSTYALNAEAGNMPLKSFKLFLKPTIEGAGWDQPLMSPEDVFALEPRPYLIMYQ